MPPAMKRLLADLQLPANRFDRRALVEVHLRLAQLRNDLLRRVSLPFHRVLPPSRAVRLSYQLVHLEGVRSPALSCSWIQESISFSLVRRSAISSIRFTERAWTCTHIVLSIHHRPLKLLRFLVGSQFKCVKGERDSGYTWTSQIHRSPHFAFPRLASRISERTVVCAMQFPQMRIPIALSHHLHSFPNPCTPPTVDTAPVSVTISP